MWGGDLIVTDEFSTVVLAPRAYIYIYCILRIIIYKAGWFTAPETRDRGSGLLLWSTYAKPPPQFPRYSRCRCAQIILFGPSCKSAAVWFMPNNTALYILGETRFQCRQMFLQSPQSTPFYNGAVYYYYFYIVAL